MRVPFIDLAAEHVPLGDDLVAAFRRVLSSGVYVLGAEVERFEAALATELGVRHVVGLSSGTDALVAALTALDVGPGDEVITTALSFVATAEAIVRVGATPRFADIDARTLNLDPSAVERLVSRRTRAILPVHLFGRPAALDRLCAVADGAGAALVEDAAQALGARFGDRAVGAWGRIGCFSFFPTKVLGALGDGGAVATDELELAARCRRLRQHGAAGPDDYAELGGNFRLDALQAALLGEKLPALRAAIAARRRVAERYCEALGSIRGLRLPELDADACWSLYTLRVLDGRRDALAAHLAERGVQTRSYYRVPLHRQRLFARYATAALPETERAAAETLSLPLHPSLSEEAQAHVIRSVRELFED